MDAHLHILEGPRRGERIRLRPSGSVVGREPGEGVDVVLPDAHVSSRHARLVFDPAASAWTVEDLGSTNGTRLGGETVRRPVPVPPGARITFGHGCVATLDVRGEAPALASPSPPPVAAPPRRLGRVADVTVTPPPPAPAAGPDVVALREAVDLLRTRTDDARTFLRQIDGLVGEVERAASASPLEAQRTLRALVGTDGSLVDLRVSLEELIDQLAQAVRWFDETLDRR